MLTAAEVAVDGALELGLTDLSNERNLKAANGLGLIKFGDSLLVRGFCTLIWG